MQVPLSVRLSAGRVGAEMHILGMSAGEIFGALFIGLGPVRVTLAYMPLARELSRERQRGLAWRIVAAGIVIAFVIIAVGGGVARSFSPREEYLRVGAGLVLLGSALRATRPVREPAAPERPDVMQVAISPLAVPVMINPVGVATLFGVAAFVPNVGETLVFVGMVMLLMGMNLVTMILSVRVAERFSVAILAVIAEVMVLLMAALGAVLVLEALADLGAITLV